MIRRFLLLNGFAILAVILFHASGWGFVAMFAWPHRYLPVTSPNYDQLGSLSYYGLRAVEQLIVFSIPAFLFVSGFFIAFATGRNQTTVSWKIVGTRIKFLLIPYLLWSFIIFVLFFLEGKRFSPVGYLRMLLTGETNPAYYFVPLLSQFYLLSPFLIPLARHRWVALLVVAGLIQLAVQLSQYPFLLGLDLPAIQPFVDVVPKWLFPARIFWFSFGIVAGFHLNGLKEWITKYKWFLLAVVLITYVVGIFEWEVYFRLSGEEWLNHRETLIDNLYSAALVLTLLAFNVSAVPLSKQIGDLGTKSFGIYLVHSPVMEYLSRIIFHLAPWILAYQIIFQPILIVVGLAVPLLLMALVKRSPARGFYQYIFG
jgi:peptidoglycan/LPS O-acetylase OafA/YrhL